MEPEVVQIFSSPTSPSYTHFVRKLLEDNQTLVAEITRKQFSEQALLEEINLMKQKLASYESIINIQMNQKSFSVDSSQPDFNEDILIKGSVENDDQSLNEDNSHSHVSKRKRTDSTISLCSSNESSDNAISKKNRVELNHLPKHTESNYEADKVYCFALTETFSYEIWKNLENFPVKSSCLQREKMNHLERDECNRLLRYIKALILNVFDRKTSFNYIRKTKSGYTVNTHCTKGYLCESNWKTKVYLNLAELSIQCNKTCEHVASSEMKNPQKIFKFASDTRFSSNLWQRISNGKSKKIILKNLTQSENIEIRNLKEFSEQLLVKEFNRDTFYSYMKKSSSGYTIYRHCAKGRANCESRWVININVLEKEAIVTVRNPCTHHIF